MFSTARWLYNKLAFVLWILPFPFQEAVNSFSCGSLVCFFCRLLLHGNDDLLQILLDIWAFHYICRYSYAMCVNLLFSVFTLELNFDCLCPFSIFNFHFTIPFYFTTSPLCRMAFFVLSLRWNFHWLVYWKISLSLLHSLLNKGQI